MAMSTKNKKICFSHKKEKIKKFYKKWKKLLTNDKNCAKIVNCIIIAHNMFSLGMNVNL